jgi:cytochrome P450
MLQFLASANRDPGKWEKPELSELLRTTNARVGFGQGNHQCPGQLIGMEARMIVDALAERYGPIRRSGEAKRTLDNNTLHALASLPVSVQLS